MDKPQSVTPPPTETPARDYYAEAMAMLKGDSRMLPQLDHLKAMLVRLAQSENQRSLITISYIATLLSEGFVGKELILTSASVAFDIAALQMGLDVAKDPDGTIRVRLDTPYGIQRPSTTTN